MKYKKISIVIPVYNEEKFIQETLDRVIASNTLKLKKEIVIVDDASQDSTLHKIHHYLRLKATHKVRDSAKERMLNYVINDSFIKVIQKNVNEGKSSALKKGILQTTGDIILIQDADLEYNPEDYLLLIDPFLKCEADVVYGSRFMSGRAHRVLSYRHYLANVVLTTISNILTNLHLTDMETGYKAFKGDLIRPLALKLKSREFGFEPEITARISKIKDLKIYEVGISYTGRTYADGKKVNWKDGVKAFLEIIKYNVFTK